MSYKQIKIRLYNDQVISQAGSEWALKSKWNVYVLRDFEIDTNGSRRERNIKYFINFENYSF